MTPSRRLALGSLAILIVAAPLFFASHQASKARRFEIGPVDLDFLARPDAFHRPTLMSGPVRREDGTVEVLDFYGRITRRRAELELPYHAIGSPLRLVVRSHRFGLEGSVGLTVNGEDLGDFVFGETSYPWGGIRAVVPQDVAERGPIRITLEVEGGNPPPSHLPDDIGLGIDWLEVEPMSLAASIRPGARAYASFYAFVLGGFLLALVTFGRRLAALAILSGVVSLVCALTALYPVETGVALSRLVVVFPLAALVHLLVRSRFATWLFTAAALLHAALLFFPNHHPPDVPQHAMQLALLSEHELTYDGISDYARRIGRTITEEMVVIDREGETDDVPDRTFRAPYPPFFFLLTYALTRLHPDPPFVLELTGVLLAAFMLVLVFLMARSIWQDPLVARMAATLFFLEISVWHHVVRGHSPGIFGAFFVLLYLWALVSFPAALERRKGLAGFALLTAVVALSYTVAFIQLSIFTGLFVAGSLLFADREERRSLLRLTLGFALGIAGAVLLFYAPYLLDALAPSAEGGVIYDRAGGFDPPASYHFLRNHLRDTVRIYRNGFPVYVALSLIGYGVLARSGASTFRRRFLWTGLGTYAFILLLKDPFFLPRIFLHAKEDLFYSPFACLVGALPLVWLWKRRAGRALVAVVLAGLALLSVRDQSFSANTTRSQPLARLEAQSQVFARANRASVPRRSQKTALPKRFSVSAAHGG